MLSEAELLKESEVVLPAEVEELLEMSVFDKEDMIDDQKLNKYLMYMPDVARLLGLVMASKKQIKRDLARVLARTEAKILISAANGIDSHKYKNEQLRNARVVSDPEYQRVLELVDKMDGQMDVIMEHIWKYKNLMRALSDIAKLRITERRL